VQNQECTRQTGEGGSRSVLMSFPFFPCFMPFLYLFAESNTRERNRAEGNREVLSGVERYGQALIDGGKDELKQASDTRKRQVEGDGKKEKKNGQKNTENDWVSISLFELANSDDRNPSS